MKVCPQCHRELPDAAHFCPACMYRYPKQEIRISSEKKKRMPTIVLGVVVIAVYALGSFGVYDKVIGQPKRQKAAELEAYQKIIDEKEEKRSDIPYHPSIVYDLRDALTDYGTVEKFLAKEPNEIWEKAEITYYLYDKTMFYVKNGKVIQIVIYCLQADDTQKAQYGIYGINGFSTREDVSSVLGEPDNGGEPQWVYYFEGENGPLSLNVAFDERNYVKKISFIDAAMID